MNINIVKALELELLLRGLKDGSIKWTTKSGTEISIKDMSTQHIINTLLFIEKENINYENNMDALSGFSL